MVEASWRLATYEFQLVDRSRRGDAATKLSVPNGKSGLVRTAQP
jgi:hypothetical protein